MKPIDGGSVRAVMADLAFAFHWQPSEIKDLSLDELFSFHDLAMERMAAWKKG